MGKVILSESDESMEDALAKAEIELAEYDRERVMPRPDKLTPKQEEVRKSVMEKYPAMPLEVLGASLEGNLEALREGLTAPIDPGYHYGLRSAPSNYLLQFFDRSHLPEHLAEVVREFAQIAKWMDKNLSDNPQRDLAFEKLLEAKDCAVRARIMK